MNAAGLHATRVARLLGAPAETIPRAHFAKGNYFTYSGRSPFTHLVYPLPEDGGLGVHATLDLAGRVRFGPDVEWLRDDVDARLARLCRRPRPFRGVLRRDPQLLAGATGPRPCASVFGNSPEDFGPG